MVLCWRKTRNLVSRHLQCPRTARAGRRGSRTLPEFQKRRGNFRETVHDQRLGSALRPRAGVYPHLLHPLPPRLRPRQTRGSRHFPHRRDRQRMSARSLQSTDRRLCELARRHAPEPCRSAILGTGRREPHPRQLDRRHRRVGQPLSRRRDLRTAVSGSDNARRRHLCGAPGLHPSRAL